MKFVIALLVLFSGIITASAQKEPLSSQPKQDRCGTMQLLDELMKQDTAMKARYEQFVREAEQRQANQKDIHSLENIRTTTAILTIPVVFHIVLPNPFIVTDADIQAQIDRLNLDLSGLNPDSTNAANFYSTRGRSRIRFCLARRDPNGNLTNGIQRRASSTGYDVTVTPDPIKTAAAGGLDAWDANRYLNIWVGTGTLLGYATLPGTSIASQQGVVIDVLGTSSNPCYVHPRYNLGKTAIHEVGHYLGLYHNWGDDDTACAGDDFRQLPGTCRLPDSLLIGDTPNQAGSTFGCPSGIRTDNCSPAAPGFQYQNYMDYTDDACITMFTKAQATRMEWVLENCRPGLLTSLGCVIPAAAPNLDAAVISVVNPGGSEVVGCNVVSYSPLSCPGSFTPKIMIQNKGLTVLTSIKVGLQVNAGPAVVQTFNVNIPSGGHAVLTLAPQSLNTGNHSLRFFTSEPNGGTDQVTSNDQLTVNVNIASSMNIPITEGFEGTTFPPVNWTIFNPNNNFTWVRRTNPGNGTTASAFIDNYNNNGAGQVDDIRSPGLIVPAGTSDVRISFDLAHKTYSSLPTSIYLDTLSVLTSSDCGATFTTVYKKWGLALATAGADTADYTTPVASDWRNEVILVPNSQIPGGQLLVAFRNTNRYGNNIFLDNINITAIYNRDIQLATVNKPSDIECSSNFTPSVTVKNAGSENITAFNVSYNIDNGTIATTNVTGVNIPKNGTMNVTLANVTGVSQRAHLFKAYTSALVTVNGTGDQNTSNDSLTKAFTITGSTQAPLVANFESLSFPPTGWGVSNPDNGITWKRASVGNNSSGSAFMNNYNYSDRGRVDQLFSPLINYSGVDSVLLSFDLSAVTRSFPGTTIIPLDTLEVLVTKDCGNTYTSVYKKWGKDLQTINDPNNPQPNEFFPSNNSQWRTEQIDLTSFAGISPIQIVFRNTNNYENNIFIDNVNLKTRVLPPRLKKDGYIILPNPFQNSFAVWHVQRPIDLKFINVYNSTAQLVWSKRYSTNAANYITIDLTGKPAGVYFINLGYDDKNKNIVERIVKY